MTREMEIRLIGHPSDDGQLLASDAVRLIEAFRHVTYRLTRAVADRPGLGRTVSDLEGMATVRVRLAEGSTRLVFEIGDTSAVIDPLSEGVDRAFLEIIEGMRLNTRPPGVSDAVASSVGELVGALHRAAPQAQFTVDGQRSAIMRTEVISRDPWQPELADSSGEVTVHGTLEMVDLRTAKFRLRDTVGNRIDLVDVQLPEQAAHLIDERVSVVGVLLMGRDHRHHRIESPIITRAPSHDTLLTSPGPSTLGELVETASQLAAPSRVDLSDEELDSFLAEIRA